MVKMSKVAVIRCESYDYAEVLPAVRRGIELVGGAGAFAAPNESILLKPNWLMPLPPERCATTHPLVFKAVAEIFKETGAVLSCGDSSGVTSPSSHIAEKTGFRPVMDELDIKQADFTNGREVFFEGARQNKKLFLANGALDADGIISVSKLKTHAFMKLTGAIKNQFGCVPGLLKGEFHIKLPDPKDFARMLVDINLYLRPRLYVMDGIMAMEGNGPMNGTPKAMNVLLMSADPVALDATVCRMLGVDPRLSLTVTAGKDSGLGVFEEGEIELLGDPPESFIDLSFKADRQPIRGVIPGKGFMRIANGLLVPRPYIIGKKCKKCGVCRMVCPARPRALDWRVNKDGTPDRSRPPVYQYKRCIRCFCCQELCPEGAVEVKKPLLRKILGK